MSRPIKTFYEFGPFRLDAQKYRLLCHDCPVAVPPRAMEALIVLVQNPGKMLEREAMIQAVWKDTFVEDANLTVAVSQLRKALGQYADAAGYIETIPRVGYRFLAEVREVKEQPTPLIIEKRTLVKTVIEEEDCIPDQPHPAAEPVNVQVSSPNNLIRVIRNHSTLAFLSIVVALAGILTAADYYRRGRTQIGLVSNTLPTVNSIAVLPPKALAPEADNTSLSVGMADALITRLGSLRKLVVRPTSAVARYAGTQDDSLAIGRALGVDAVLEGSLQRVDDRIRLTLRLLSVLDGRQLWADKFDDRFTNILAVEDSISQQVARSLLPNLSDDERKSLTKHSTQDVQAYQLYLKGRFFWNKRSAEGLKTAVSYFEQAIEKDSSYAQAYAGLADSYALLSNFGFVSRDDGYAKAKAAALSALEIDKDLSEPHASLAYVLRNYDWNWQEAEIEFKRSIELNPNYSTAHHWYGLYLTTKGRLAEARAEIQKALELDPLSVAINTDLGANFIYAHQPDEALKQYRKTLELDPKFLAVHYGICLAYEQKGMYGEAISEAKDDENLKSQKWILGYAYAVGGQKDRAQELAAELEHEAVAENGSLYGLIRIYAALGNKDRAYELLRKGLERRDDRLLWIKVDPAFDQLRLDLRFQELLRQMNLPLT